MQFLPTYELWACWGKLESKSPHSYYCHVQSASVVYVLEGLPVCFPSTAGSSWFLKYVFNKEWVLKKTTRSVSLVISGIPTSCISAVWILKKILLSSLTNCSVCGDCPAGFLSPSVLWEVADSVKPAAFMTENLPAPLCWRTEKYGVNVKWKMPGEVGR